MKKCPTCGQIVETERDKTKVNVFTWTTMTILVWGMTLFSSTWTASWWADRLDMVIMFSAFPLIAVYFWIRLLRGKR